MTRALTDAQKALAQAGTHGMRKTAVSRKQQIAATQRRFVYDGALTPICIRCGRPRESRRGLHCHACGGPS